MPASVHLIEKLGYNHFFIPVFDSGTDGHREVMVELSQLSQYWISFLTTVLSLHQLAVSLYGVNLISSLPFYFNSALDVNNF